MFINRLISKSIVEYLEYFPVLVLLGARQVGKTTLIKHIAKKKDDVIFLDLEKESDRLKLTNAELYFNQHGDKLICIDEVQYMPQLFQKLRYVIDENRRNGRFLLLGSASRDIIQHSSESLAGRVFFMDMRPFVWQEIKYHKKIEEYWWRGGFPDSVLAISDKASQLWRRGFIRTFLERDIPQMGFNIPANTLLRMWTMLAHIQGQVINTSQLGKSLGASHTTMRNYLDLLERTFIIKQLKPFEANVKKRLVKAPKVYIRDTGLLHELLNIESFENLLGNPVIGASWETMVIENITAQLPDWEHYYYRTHAGSELDLVCKKGNQLLAFECKVHAAPKLTKGFYTAIEDVQPQKTFVVAQSDELYPIAENIWIGNLEAILNEIR